MIIVNISCLALQTHYAHNHITEWFYTREYESDDLCLYYKDMNDILSVPGGRIGSQRTNCLTNYVLFVNLLVVQFEIGGQNEKK
jgi:hypothetical protein